VTFFDNRRGKVIYRSSIYYDTINSASSTVDPDLRLFAVGSNYTGKIYIAPLHSRGTRRILDVPKWLHPDYFSTKKGYWSNNTHLTVRA